jgi:NAD(P)-dependent dehydrogenase (short-subunit alcohol dehydrogenase family)
MSELKINPEGKIALVSGGNRGIGKAIVIELLEKGAKKVYAGARNPSTLNILKDKYGDRLVPIQLDVTSKDSIAAVAKEATDVEILVNNAGRVNFGGIFADGAEDALTEDLSVNVHGLLNLTRALINTLKSQTSAAIVNVSSLAGLANMPMIGTYSITKAAVHSITQGIRGELAEENILVAGVYPGAIDTDLVKDLEMDKDSPENVAKNVVNALIEGVEDVFPDVMSAQAGPGYQASPKAIEKEFAAYIG